MNLETAGDLESVLSVNGDFWIRRCPPEASSCSSLLDARDGTPRPTFYDAIGHEYEYYRDRSERRSQVHRLVLLGPGESGKSTVLKQMQIIHQQGFSDKERREKIAYIRRNLTDAMLSIVGAMVNPDATVRHSNQKSIDYMLNVAAYSSGDPDEEFYDHAKLLWNDPAVQKCYERAHEYQLIDCAKYFLEKIDDIRKEDYVPTDQDILRCRIMTTGILQTEFTIKKVQFHIFDVGGQRAERRRWIQCFKDLTAIIFVAAISSYNMAVREDEEHQSLVDDPTRNRVTESLKLFRVIWGNRWLNHLSVILFLNKQDVLKEQCRKSQIDDYFSDYATFRNDFDSSLVNPPKPSRSWCCLSSASPNKPKSSVAGETSDDPEFECAKAFFRIKFEILAVRNSRQAVDEAPEARRDSVATRRLFPHCTCAVDTENIKRVFKSCHRIIQNANINAYLIM